jgi:predicted glycoside hydrolase/deacetylase ChbG (UPF0249 family)
MLIINADDWGGWTRATDAALACFEAGRITTASAMVFMADSERAAVLAKEKNVEIGLHLNLDSPLTGATVPADVAHHCGRVARFLRSSKYAQLVYHPFLQASFRYVFRAQFDEFVRLYGTDPSHIDGHHHMHLCSNMRVGKVIPRGQKIRRSFSFRRDEKSLVNRIYRACISRSLSRRFRITDHLFSLADCLRRNRLERVAELAQNFKVELMTHPEMEEESAFLLSDRFTGIFRNARLEGYLQL